jgi:transcriptional regulator with XRE-family HTH domain
MADEAVADSRSSEAESIGQRIRRLREEKRMTLSGLAAAAEMSKGYLWNLESGKVDSRPSATTLYGLAQALGVAMSDLLGRPLLINSTTGIPPELRQFADDANLPETDVEMLAGIQFRGDQPRTKERWQYIYNAIRHSAGMDGPAGSS